MKKMWMCVWMAYLAGTGSLLAQEKALKPVSLQEFIRMAVEQNPQVQAAKKEWEAALQMISQAKSLPDPILSYARFGQSIETRLGPQRNKVSLSQKFPFFGKLSIKGEMARKNALVLEEQYRGVVADIALQVKQAYFSLFWVDQATRIAQEERDVFRRLARIAAKKYETGKASQQDVLKAQLEISKVTDRLLLLSQARKAAASRLNALLNRSPETPIPMVPEVSFSPLELRVEDLYAMARKFRPELRKVRSVIQKNEQGVKLAKRNYYPDFQVMLDYIDIGAGSTTHPKDGRNAWMAAIGITIPLWRKKLHAAEAEAVLRRNASEALLENVENDTFASIHELFHEVRTIQEQVDLYKYSLLPQAEQAFKASEVGYLAGKVDFLNLLDSERMVLMVKNGYYKALADLGKSSAKLERVVGTELFPALSAGGYSDVLDEEVPQ
ncbi:MAG: TolC family protein [Candidatus Aminicenantales bacterium]